MNNSISKILTGINNTLNIANKAIPIYNQAKPIIGQASKTFKQLKYNRNDLSKIIKLMRVKNQIKGDFSNKSITVNNSSKELSNINNPTFFI